MTVNSMLGLVPCAAVLTMATSQCLGQNAAPETNQGPGTPNTNAIRIVVQPMAYNRAEWNTGDRLTVKVTCESDNGPTRVIGIATDVELVATKTYDNRWEMMLRSTDENIAKIRAAADLSEYWFTVTLFADKHRSLVAAEPRIEDFLEKNKDYRPADGKNWGLNASSNERLRIPTKDELPRRPTKAEPTDEREPE